MHKSKDAGNSSVNRRCIIQKAGDGFYSGGLSSSKYGRGHFLFRSREGSQRDAGSQPQRAWLDFRTSQACFQRSCLPRPKESFVRSRTRRDSKILAHPTVECAQTCINAYAGRRLSPLSTVRFPSVLLFRPPRSASIRFEFTSAANSCVHVCACERERVLILNPEAIVARGGEAHVLRSLATRAWPCSSSFCSFRRYLPFFSVMYCSDTDWSISRISARTAPGERAAQVVKSRTACPARESDPGAYARVGSSSPHAIWKLFYKLLARCAPPAK